MSEITTSQKVEVTYSTDAGTRVKHSLDARADITAEEVSTAADTIISKNVFGDSEGNAISVAESALLRTITEKPLF